MSRERSPRAALKSAIDRGPLRRCSADLECEPSAAFHQATQIVRIDGGSGRSTDENPEQILNLSRTLADGGEIECSSATVDSVCKSPQLHQSR